MTACSGTVAAYFGSGASPTPRKNTLCNPPINTFPSPNASEYVTSAHSTVITAIIAKVCIIVPRIFFFPHQPPVEQRQPRPAHHQHQSRRNQHPAVVSRRLRRSNQSRIIGILLL